MVFADPSPCPCGSKKPYAACCGRLHDGLAQAADAEALMRARYSAFAKRRADFVLATWAPETRPASLSLPLDETWTGLTVSPAEPLGQDRAIVRFAAHWRRGAAAGVLRETSRFRRENGAWLYVDGDLS